MKKVIKNILIGAGAATGVLILASILYVFIGGRDAPAPDVADLKLDRPEVAPDENAFTVFGKAISARYWPAEHDEECVTDYLKDDCAFGKDFVRRTLERNAETFEHLREGVRREVCLAPLETEPIPHYSYLGQWRDMARLLAVKARFSRNEGEYEEATEACVTLLRFGDMIKNHPNTLIHYLVGIAVQAIGLDETRKLVDDAELNDKQLDKLFKTLADLSPAESGFVHAMKGEYRFTAIQLDSAAEDPANIIEMAGGQSLPRPVELALQNRWISSYVLHRNRTKAALAGVFRELIANSERCYAELTLKDAEKPDTQGIVNLIKLPLRPNPLGRMCVPLLASAFDRTLQEKLKLESELKATRLIVALHAYHRSEKHLPENLDALVPRYLDKIPTDPYDGELFRYDRSLDVVYSVGENLEDNGGKDVLRALGEEDWQWRQGDDFVFAIGIRDEHFREKMADITKHHRDEQMRRLAVKHVTDQQLLTEIVRGDYDTEMRSEAAKNLTDQSVIKAVLRQEDNPAIRRSAVRGLKDLNMLIEIATDADEKVREWSKDADDKGQGRSAEADEKAQDRLRGERRRSSRRHRRPERYPRRQSARRKPREIRMAEKMRDSAAQRIGEAEVIEQYVETEGLSRDELFEKLAAMENVAALRRVAAENLTDQARLVEMALNDEDPGVRSAAVKRIEDRGVVRKVAAEDAAAAVRRVAVERVNDENLLMSIAKEDEDGEVRLEAVRKVGDESVLERIALDDEDGRVRAAAVERVTDQDVIADVALKDESASARESAVKKLTDQGLLERIARNDQDWSVRMHAVSKLEDAEVVRSIAREDNNSFVRAMAELKLFWGF
ncbi:MAG: HEAT repeat domain-containing protein [Candidatus Brocadiia bacterium]